MSWLDANARSNCLLWKRQKLEKTYNNWDLEEANYGTVMAGLLSSRLQTQTGRDGQKDNLSDA